MSSTTPECVWSLGAQLGEGPVWHSFERALYFVDIKGWKIHRWFPDSGQHDSWSTPAQPGFVVLVDAETLLCGMQGGLYRFSPGNGRFIPHQQIEATLPHNRLNDGYVDGQGRLWFGSMSDNETDATGSLYCLGHNGELRMQDRGYVITNGPALSPEGHRLYHTDTLQRAIYVFDVAADGHLSNRKLFITTPEPGFPDGMAIDTEGCLWVAFFGGWRIDRYSPQGDRLMSIPFPCANITKLAFGGSDLCTVFVTTATKGLSEQDRTSQPLAGGLFTWRSPVAGLPSHTCQLMPAK